jgi:PBSX family phage terminase large subunit
MNAFAAMLWSKRGSVWYGEKEYYYSGRDTGVQKTDQEYMNDLNEWIKDTWEYVQDNPVITAFGMMTDKIETIIDPSAASFIALLKRSEWAKVRQADNAVNDGIRETAVALQTGKVKVLKSCTNWVKEAGGYVWDNSEGEERPVKVNDHAMDNTRYFVKTKRVVRPHR